MSIMRLVLITVAAGITYLVLMSVLHHRDAREESEAAFRLYMFDMMSKCEERKPTFECMAYRQRWAEAWDLDRRTATRDE